ncbi:MAG: hypothetical protein U1F10_02040 [Burkholderiales bacterium]
MTHTPPPAVPASPEQLAYARVLRVATRVGFFVMVVAFAAYVTGLLPAHVPLAELPSLWGLPAAQFRAASGAAVGWGWVRHLGEGDVASFAGIAVLAAGSLASLGAVLVRFLRRGDRAYALITLALIAVIVVAASGVLNRLH